MDLSRPASPAASLPAASLVDDQKRLVPPTPGFDFENGVFNN